MKRKPAPTHASSNVRRYLADTVLFIASPQPFVFQTFLEDQDCQIALGDLYRFPRCRVGRGGAYRPASARSLKRLVQFSRKPLSYVGRAGWRRLGRIPGTRWISRTRPKSAMRHEDGYRRHAVFRHRLLMKDHSRRSIHPSSLWNSFRTFAFR